METGCTLHHTFWMNGDRNRRAGVLQICNAIRDERSGQASTSCLPRRRRSTPYKAAAGLACLANFFVWRWVVRRRRFQLPISKSRALLIHAAACLMLLFSSHPKPDQIHTNAKMRHVVYRGTAAQVDWSCVAACMLRIPSGTVPIIPDRGRSLVCSRSRSTACQEKYFQLHPTA